MRISANPLKFLRRSASQDKLAGRPTVTIVRDRDRFRRRSGNDEAGDLHFSVVWALLLSAGTDWPPLFRRASKAAARELHAHAECGAVPGVAYSQ